MLLGLLMVSQMSFSNQWGIGGFLTSGGTLLIPYKISDNNLIEAEIRHSNYQWSPNNRETQTYIGTSYLIYANEQHGLKPYYGSFLQFAYFAMSSDWQTDKTRTSIAPVLGLEYELQPNLTIAAEGKFFLMYNDDDDSHWESDMYSNLKFRYYF